MTRTCMGKEDLSIHVHECLHLQCTLETVQKRPAIKDDGRPMLRLCRAPPDSSIEGEHTIAVAGKHRAQCVSLEASQPHAHDQDCRVRGEGAEVGRVSLPRHLWG